MTISIHLKPSIDNYCVMGNPIAHSKSPLIHHAFAEQVGHAIYYQSVLVQQGQFEGALAEFQKLGGKGLNITVPFKEDAWQAVEAMSTRAEKAGAVNTIWFEKGKRQGDNTDGIGLVRDLLENEIKLKDKRLLILGAGGAVRGILDPILQQEPSSVLIANRTPERAETLVRRFSEYSNLDFCGLSQLDRQGNFDVVINGISAGLSGEQPELPEDIVVEGGCCYDMVYGNVDTPFVSWAKQHGAGMALDGLGMLVEQAAESFMIWRGVRPKTKPVIEMLRNL